MFEFEAREMISQLDTDQSGEIEYEEFRSAQKKHKRKRMIYNQYHSFVLCIPQFSFLILDLVYLCHTYSLHFLDNLPSLAGLISSYTFPSPFWVSNRFHFLFSTNLCFKVGQILPLLLHS